MDESDQSRFFERIDGNDFRAAFHGVLERAQHPRMVGAGVLAHTEDRVRIDQVLQRDRPLPMPMASFIA